MTTRQSIERNMNILRAHTGLNYQLDISGIPTGYKLVMTDLTTGGEWDVSHRMPPKQFLTFLYSVNTFCYENDKRRHDKRFLLSKELEVTDSDDDELVTERMNSMD